MHFSRLVSLWLLTLISVCVPFNCVGKCVVQRWELTFAFLALTIKHWAHHCVVVLLFPLFSSFGVDYFDVSCSFGSQFYILLNFLKNVLIVVTLILIVFQQGLNVIFDYNFSVRLNFRHISELLYICFVFLLRSAAYFLCLFQQGFEI